MKWLSEIKGTHLYIFRYILLKNNKNISITIRFDGLIGKFEVKEVGPMCVSDENFKIKNTLFAPKICFNL